MSNDLRGTALHEAGHALVLFQLDSSLLRALIRPWNGSGLVQSNDYFKLPIVERVAVPLSGQLAELSYAPEQVQPSRWRSDEKQIADMLAPFDDERRKELRHEAGLLCLKIFDEHKATLFALRDLLLEEKTIEGARLEKWLYCRTRGMTEAEFDAPAPQRLSNPPRWTSSTVVTEVSDPDVFPALMRLPRGDRPERVIVRNALARSHSAGLETVTVRGAISGLSASRPVAPVPKPAPTDMKRTAQHEAGHLVAAVALGIPALWARVYSPGERPGAAGATRYPASIDWRCDVTKVLAVTIAPSYARFYLSGESPGRWDQVSTHSHDLADVKRLLRERVAADDRQRVYEEAKALADETMAAHVVTLERVVDLLSREVSGEAAIWSDSRTVEAGTVRRLLAENREADARARQRIEQAAERRFEEFSRARHPQTDEERREARLKSIAAERAAERASTMQGRRQRLAMMER